MGGADGRVEILELGRDDAAEPNFCGKFCICLQ